MGLFGGGNKTTNSTSTITNVEVNPAIDVINNFGELSTVLNAATDEFNSTLDKGLKTVTAIVLLWFLTRQL